MNSTDHLEERINLLYPEVARLNELVKSRTIMTKMFCRLLCICLLAIVWACAPTKNLSPNNAYSRIVQILVNDLDSDQDKEFVKEQYPIIITAIENSAEQELATESRFRWKNALTDYNRLQYLNSLLADSEIYSSLIAPGKDYEDTILDLRLRAAEDVYNEAVESLAIGNHEAAKAAYFQLLEAQQLSEGKIYTEDLMNEALEIAHISVAVSLDTTNNYGIDLDSLRVEVNNALSPRKIGGPFVSFSSYDEALSDDKVEHLVEINLVDYVTGQINKSQFSQPVESTGGEMEILEESIDIAFVFEIKITELYLKQEIDRSTIRISRTLENLVGKYDGEISDLNEYQKSLLGNKPMEGNPPYVFGKIIKPAISDITGSILEFYQNY